MPLLNYNINQTLPGFGHPFNFNLGEDGQTYNIPPSPQLDTVTVTTGDATTGWQVIITNSTNLATYTFTFDPVDSAGVASAVTTDAARTMRDTWNSDVNALQFGLASVAGAVVTITYASDQFVYALVVNEAGAGAATVVSPATAGDILQIEWGTFAFRPTDAAIAAGADPRRAVTPTGAILEQFSGGVVKRLGAEGGGPDTANTFGTYVPTEQFTSMQRGQLIMPAAVAISVTDGCASVDAGGVSRHGWLTPSGGGFLDLPATSCRVIRGAAAGDGAVVEFTLA